MGLLRYFAGPGAEVSFATAKGEARTVSFDARGFYATADEDEIAVLDAMATDPGSLIQHADDKMAAGAASKTKTTTTDEKSEDDDAADR